MTQIEIPFALEMAREAITGHVHPDGILVKKDVTTRGKIYGKPGDTFYIENPDVAGEKHLFSLTQIEKYALGYVAQKLYKREGFESPVGFIEIWNRLHPGAGFDKHNFKYTHFFEEAKE